MYYPYFQKARTATRIVRQLTNWPALFWDVASPRRESVLPNKYVTYSFRNGLRLTVRAHSADTWALTDVMLADPYGLQEIRTFVGKMPTIIDLGAHVGTFTLAAARAFPDSRIVALEPAQESFALLQENIRANHLQNVTAVRAAAGPKDGEAKILVDPAQAVFASTLTGVPGTGGPLCHSEIVPMRSLSTLLLEHHLERVDFLKCDIQGGEFALFSSLPRSTWIRIHSLALEYHCYRDHLVLSSLLGVLYGEGFEVLHHRVVRRDFGFLFCRRRES